MEDAQPGNVLDAYTNIFCIQYIIILWSDGHIFIEMLHTKICIFPKWKNMSSFSTTLFLLINNKIISCIKNLDKGLSESYLLKERKIETKNIYIEIEKEVKGNKGK